MNSLELRIRPLQAYLVVAALANPAVGLFYAVVHPNHWDSWVARFVLSGMCLIALGASYHHRLREYIDTMATICAWAMMLWYTARGRFAGFELEHVLFLVLLAIIGIAVMRVPAHATPIAVLTSATLAWAYGGSGPYAVSLLFVQAILWLTYISVGLTFAHRHSLELALDAANIELQHQVDQLQHEVKERALAEREALQASRAKSAFLANMSHELRTPLNAIIGYTELIEDELDAGGGVEAHDDIARVLSSAHHLLAIIDDVLDVARIEAEQLQLQITRLRLLPILAYCADMVRPAAKTRGNQLMVSVDAQLAVMGDETRVKQVVLNLLSNAAKHTTNGTIEVDVIDNPDLVSIRVRDTGIGIPESALPALFDKFTQVDSSSTRTSGGVGLGLAIGHELAERMGGSLTVHSTLGQGSTFTFTLPRA